jgi:hypothetical protein
MLKNRSLRRKNRRAKPKTDIGPSDRLGDQTQQYQDAINVPVTFTTFKLLQYCKDEISPSFGDLRRPIATQLFPQSRAISRTATWRRGPVFAIAGAPNRHSMPAGRAEAAHPSFQPTTDRSKLFQKNVAKRNLRRQRRWRRPASP